MLGFEYTINPQNMEFEQDWSFTLDATLGDREKIKKCYSSYKDFSCENPIVPQNLMKIVGAILEKMKILNFFLM